MLLMKPKWISWWTARSKQSMVWRADVLLRALLAWCCWLGVHAVAADVSPRLPAPVAEALAQSGIPESSVGIFVMDTQAARPVVAVGDERALNPASTIKLLTTFAALDQLGPAYRWTTELY